MDVAGARFAAGQAMTERSGSGSVTCTAVRVTSPLLVITNRYVSRSPAETVPSPSTSSVPPSDFTRPMAADCAGNTVAVAGCETTPVPDGPVADARAVLLITPASMSAWVMT